MKVVVLNLAGETGRWARVLEQFAHAGIGPLRREAVDGGLLPVAERDTLYSRELNRRHYHKPLSPGEIGCYASHLAAWRELAASRERCLAIFEDDVQVDRDLPLVLEAVEASQGDWDMVKLAGRCREKLRGQAPLLPGRQLVAYRRVPSLTSGYVLHRRGARKLLARRPPFGRPVDVDLRHWWECGLAILGVYPYPVREAPACVSSMVGRSLPPTLAIRLRKFCLQARYTVENWQAVRGLQAPLALAAVRATAHSFRGRP